MDAPAGGNAVGRGVLVIEEADCAGEPRIAFFKVSKIPMACTFSTIGVSQQARGPPANSAQRHALKQEGGGIATACQIELAIYDERLDILDLTDARGVARLRAGYRLILTP